MHVFISFSTSEVDTQSTAFLTLDSRTNWVKQLIINKDNLTQSYHWPRQIFVGSLGHCWPTLSCCDFIRAVKDPERLCFSTCQDSVTSGQGQTQYLLNSGTDDNDQIVRLRYVWRGFLKLESNHCTIWSITSCVDVSMTELSSCR